LLSQLLELQGPSAPHGDPTESDIMPTSSLTNDELKEELRKVLEAIGKVQYLVNSTDIDEAKLREFREFEERETQRFNKVMKYIKVLDEVKL